MAIAFGAVAGNNSNSGANTLSTASITVSGSNTKGFAYVMSAEDDVTGATWNGSAMTLVSKQTGADNVSLYYIDNPTTGVVTGNRSGTSGRLQVIGAYYTGCATGAPNASVKTSNTSTSISASIAANATPSWGILVGYGNGGNWTASTNCTNRDTQASAGGLFDTNGNVTVPITMTATANSGDNEIVCATFHESGSSVGTTVRVDMWGAGGGGGGGNASGGGAGAYIQDTAHAVSVGSYTVTVGTGGSPGNGATGGSGGAGHASGGNGASGSSLSGGGGGGSSKFDTLIASGGGGGCGGSGTVAAGAATGSSGGVGATSNGGQAGGGGGGSGTAGGNASGVTGGSAGTGGITQTGTNGAGNINNSSGGGSSAGASGNGANGGNSTGASGSGGAAAGAAGTGYDSGGGGSTGANAGGQPGAGGGGANGSGAGGAGGNGKVIITYTTGSISATGGTITTDGGNTVHTFTSSGTFTITSGPANVKTLDGVTQSTGIKTYMGVTVASTKSVIAVT